MRAGAAVVALFALISTASAECRSFTLSGRITRADQVCQPPPQCRGVPKTKVHINHVRDIASACRQWNARNGWRIPSGPFHGDPLGCTYVGQGPGGSTVMMMPPPEILGQSLYDAVLSHEYGHENCRWW